MLSECALWNLYFARASKNFTEEALYKFAPWLIFVVQYQEWCFMLVYMATAIRSADYETRLHEAAVYAPSHRQVLLLRRASSMQTSRPISTWLYVISVT